MNNTTSDPPDTAPSRHRRKALPPLLAFLAPTVLCLGMVCFDISLPLGVATGILYVPLVLCSLWSAYPPTAFIFAGAASILALTAAFLKPPGDVDLWIVIVNRLFAVGVLWLMAILIYLRLKSDAALKQNEKRYKLAVQGLSVGIWDWEPDSGRLYWSPRFKEIIGDTKTDALRCYADWESRLHPDDRRHTLKILNDHLRQCGSYDVEYRMRRDDDRYVWVHARGQAVWDEHGHPLRMAGSIDDVTIRREAERGLQKALQDLRQSNDDLESFAYIASHDLKEPLRGLVSNLAILKEDYSKMLDVGVHKRLNRMVYLCQRMEQLVDDLLYFSRLGRQELAIQVTELEEVIRDIETMMESTLQEQHAHIVLVTPLPVIICDLPRITEVFRNLITNAVKYNKSAEKRVEIGCTEMVPADGAESERVFFVRDNGIGIAPEFHRDIFRIFKRLNEEDDTTKGTGVGLSFVKKIIECHGGRIWLESKEGEGTTFYFTIRSTDMESTTHGKSVAHSAG